MENEIFIIPDEERPRTAGTGTTVLSRRFFLGAIGAWVIVPALNPLQHGMDFALGTRGGAEPQSGEAGQPKRVMEQLYLTFDDGPQDSTEIILDYLAERNQKATFFLIARYLQIQRLRDLAIRALKEGHEIGNHSYSHPSFSHISERAAEAQIREAHELIEDMIQESGVDAQSQNLFFRFPYGDEGQGKAHKVCQEVLSQLGYRIAAWTLDTNDWQMNPNRFWRQPWRVLASIKKAHSNDVVLMHDRSRTAHILRSVMDALDRKGLVSVQLSKFDQVLVDGSENVYSAEDPGPAARFDFLGIRSVLEKLLPRGKAQ